jgi:hypothetical protein
VQLKYTFALMISGIVFAAGQANADDFSFSFTNDIGNVAGTVTGEILGLTDNSTGAATDVIIESYPSALNADLFTSYTAPIDLFADPWFSTDANTFTETDGQITAADFGVDDGDFDFVTLGTGCNIGSFCGNGFGNWETSSAVEGSTISFTQLGSSTPEPSTLGLMLAGFVALTARRVRRKVLPSD